jgi:hypothetical protein
VSNARDTSTLPRPPESAAQGSTPASRPAARDRLALAPHHPATVFVPERGYAMGPIGRAAVGVQEGCDGA